VGTKLPKPPASSTIYDAVPEGRNGFNNKQLEATIGHRSQRLWLFMASSRGSQVRVLPGAP